MKKPMTRLLTYRSSKSVKVGDQFRSLRLIYRTNTMAGKKWLCICKCLTIKEVYASNLLLGMSGSCGCEQGHKTDGIPKRRIKEYRIWQGIKGRCLNPDNRAWKNYGGRGITICDEWKYSFSAFFQYVGPSPGDEYSIDRYPDNNGNYEPGNVRWATDAQQLRNTRRTHILTLGEKKQCLLDWALETGFTRQTIYNRLAKDLSDEDTLTQPRGQGR